MWCDVRPTRRVIRVAHHWRSAAVTAGFISASSSRHHWDETNWRRVAMLTGCLLHSLCFNPLTPTQLNSAPWFRTAHRHDLRPRIHDKLLLDKTSYLNDCEFVIRIHYRDSYWLLYFIFCYLLFILSAFSLKNKMNEWMNEWTDAIWVQL